MIFGLCTKSEMEAAVNAAKLEVLKVCANLAASDVKLAEGQQRLVENDKMILELHGKTLEAMRAIV